MLKVFKKKYDKVFAENHEKMLNKHIRQRNMLELFVRKKSIINQHCFKYYRSLNIPNAGLFAINSLY